MFKLKTKNYRLITSKGFTLIELLIYLAIVGVIVNSLVLFALNMMNGGTKSSHQQEVNSAAMFLSEKIKYEVRNANAINLANSDFGINLAENPGKKISLAESGSNNPSVIDVDSGNARISHGVSSPIALNSTAVRITNLTFSNLSTPDDLAKQLKFTISIAALDPSSGNVYENITIESSAEVRSR